MRKIILLIVLLVLIIINVACDKKKNNNVVKEGKGDLIIEYTSSPQELANTTYYIRIYDNKKVRYGMEGEKKDKRKTLSDQEYQDIINLAFSKKVLSLEGKDISNSMVLDGYFEYITIYDNKKEIRIGGSNPSNKYFNKLVGMINGVKKER